mgnify:CR=1 FL=1
MSAENSYLEHIKNTDRNLYNEVIEGAKSAKVSPGKYLSRVIRRLPQDLADKLMDKDPSLLSGAEIEELERIVESTPKIRKSFRDYQVLLSLHVDDETKNVLLMNFAKQFYDELPEGYRARYTQTRLRYFIPRLNLGLVEVGTSPGRKDDAVPEALYNLGLIGDRTDVIADLVARTYFSYLASEETSVDEMDKRFLSLVERLRNGPKQ